MDLLQLEEVDEEPCRKGAENLKKNLLRKKRRGRINQLFQLFLEKDLDPGFSLSSSLKESEEMVPRHSRQGRGEWSIPLDENSISSAYVIQVLQI